jgi:hypothetical protein
MCTQLPSKEMLINGGLYFFMEEYVEYILLYVNVVNFAPYAYHVLFVFI